MQYDSRYEDEGREGSTVLTRLRGMIARDERGSAAMEFGLLLPLLMLIVLGAIDFGRFAFSSITVTNAARTGAAYCVYKSASSCDITNADTVTQIKGRVQDDIAGFTVQDSDIALSTTAAGSGNGCPCLVVTVQHQFNTWVPWPGVGSLAPGTPASIIIVRTARMPIGVASL